MRMQTKLLWLGLLFLPLPVQAGKEGMSGMPLIQPKRTYTIPTREAGEELKAARGFGDQEPMVRMMNLMMVGGSGLEGMEMAPHELME
jgi:hypothetical protein